MGTKQRSTDMGLCTDNHWQPTFVHDPGHPRGTFPHYVMPDGGFIKLRGIQVRSGWRMLVNLSRNSVSAMSVDLRRVKNILTFNAHASVARAKAIVRVQ